MATLRVTCLLCDDAVEVPATEVVLHLGEPADVPLDRYGFHCPRCAVFVVRRAAPDVVEALVGTFEVEVATGPLAPWEAGERPAVLLSDAGAVRTLQDAPPVGDAPPISEADVQAFVARLEDDTALAAWLAA